MNILDENTNEFFLELNTKDKNSAMDFLKEKIKNENCKMQKIFEFYSKNYLLNFVEKSPSLINNLKNNIINDEIYKLFSKSTQFSIKIYNIDFSLLNYDQKSIGKEITLYFKDGNYYPCYKTDYSCLINFEDINIVDEILKSKINQNVYQKKLDIGLDHCNEQNESIFLENNDDEETFEIESKKNEKVLDEKMFLNETVVDITLNKSLIKSNIEESVTFNFFQNYIFIFSLNYFY